MNQVNAPQITPELINNSKTVECECGNKVFSEKIVFKKLSAIISPTGQEELIPIPVFLCEKCDKIPRIFDPKGIVPEELKTKI